MSVIDRLLPTPTPARAAAILRDVFRGVPGAFAFRLWDGSEAAFGAGAPTITVVIKAPDTFIDLMRDPSPDNFAEAYVASKIDLEGDLFSAMEVANAVENVALGPFQKLSLLVSLWRR